MLTSMPLWYDMKGRFQIYHFLIKSQSMKMLVQNGRFTIFFIMDRINQFNQKPYLVPLGD